MPVILEILFSVQPKRLLPRASTEKRAERSGLPAFGWFSLNFLVTFSFKRKSDKQLKQKKRQQVNQQIPLFLTLVTL